MPPYNLDTSKDPSEIVKNIIQRRDESRKFLKQNLWGELTETWRGIMCRTKPIYKIGSDGKETSQEDTSRTNVAMPDLAIMFWRNVARLSAQAPRLNYRGGQDPMVADMLSALFAQQYNRSNEAIQDVRVRMSCDAFGYGYSKLYWDTLSRQMRFRKAIMKGDQVAFRNRADIMRAQGAPDNEITDAVKQQGPDMSDEEMSSFMGKSGNVIDVPTDVKKYEGPCSKWVFNGDLFLEPQCLTLNESNYIIEQYKETDLWVKWMLGKKYEDPETKELKPVFDKEAVDGLLACDADPKAQVDDLRDFMLSATGKQDTQSYQFPRHLRVRKKFAILEEHCADEDGWMWVTWVSEDYRDKPLGMMPYPWDLYGHSVYTEEVPLPDLMSAYGHSTPRLSRYLYQMHNKTVAQNFDYVTQTIKKFIVLKTGVDFDPDVVQHALFQILRVNEPKGMEVLNVPPIPPGAYEREQQVIRMMSMLEPAMAATDSGTSTNPLAGKTATSQIIGAKIADAMLQFKVNGREMRLREEGQKKLWMNQQAQDENEPWTIEQKFWNQSLSKQMGQYDSQDGQANPDLPQYALSDRFGKVTAVRLDPMEIQEDFDVEPEAMSYMSVDDDLRRQAAMDLDQVALAAPDKLDRGKVIRFHLSTIKGLPGSPDDYLLPDAPPNPGAGVKRNFNISLTGKLEDLPASLMEQILQSEGLEITPQVDSDLQGNDMANKVRRFSDMSKNADTMLSPATANQPLGPEPGKQKETLPNK